MFACRRDASLSLSLRTTGAIQCDRRPGRGEQTLHSSCLSIQSQASSCVIGSGLPKEAQRLYLVSRSPFPLTMIFKNPFECVRMGFARTRESGSLSADITCSLPCNQSNQASTVHNQAYLDSKLHVKKNSEHWVRTKSAFSFCGLALSDYRID